MAKLRKAVCYRKLELPYTRKSKKREKSYVRGAPVSKIVLFDMGNRRDKFPYRISLISRDSAQVRHNALESSRIAVNKKLSNLIGESNYYFKVKIFPHHVLRENALAAGAGADRYSTGMAHSFGKPVGLAAQVRKGQEIMYIDTTEKFIEIAKKSIRQATYKCPIKTRVEIKQIKNSK